MCARRSTCALVRTASLAVSALALASVPARVLFAQRAAPSGSAAEASRPNAPPRLIIVAPKNLHHALSAFVRYKQQLLPTELVALEVVLASTEGADDPEKLKHYLYDAWQQHPARYVLLVGDADVMPVRFMVVDRNVEAAFNFFSPHHRSF